MSTIGLALRLPAASPPVTAAGPFDLAFQVVEGGLHRLHMERMVARRIGLKGMHRVIGRTLAWELWLDALPGVMGWEAMVPSNGPASAVDLAVLYYPAITEAVLERFSPQERAYRRGTMFDAAGAPRFRDRGRLDGDAFVVGLIRLDVAEEGGALRVEAMAPAPWPQPAGRDDVPCWPLTWQGLNLLMRLIGFAWRTAPAVAREWRVPDTAGGWYDGVEALLPLGVAERPIAPVLADTRWIDAGWWDAAHWARWGDGPACSCCEAEAGGGP